MNIDLISTIIDWILRLAGFATIIIGFISFFTKYDEFEVNGYIDKLDLHNYEKVFEYTDEKVNGEYLLFLPQGNTNFKKVNFCEYIFTGKKFKKGKVIKSFNNINCTNGIIFNTYYPCGAPSRMFEWEADYGVKKEYILAENGKDGNVKYGNYIYQYNLISKLRRKIDWK
jgi:hypothetical protein